MKKFNFWKENNYEHEYERSGEQLQNQFLLWLPQKEKDWLNYYSIDTVIRNFLTAKDGMNCTFQERDFWDIHETLNSVFVAYMKKIDTKNWANQ